MKRGCKRTFVVMFRVHLNRKSSRFVQKLDSFVQKPAQLLKVIKSKDKVCVKGLSFPKYSPNCLIISLLIIINGYIKF